MAVNSRALITAETYVLATRGPAPGDNPDTKLTPQVEFAINAASNYIETECNRMFLSGSIETEVFDGKGYDDVLSYAHTSYTLKQAPITTSPNSPRLYLYSTDTWTLVSNDSFTYDATDGTIYFAGSSDYDSGDYIGQLGGTGSYFERGKNNYKVEYYYGYNGRANIPSDLQIATAVLAKFFNVSTDHAGVANESTEKKSQTFTNKIPIVVQQVISRYKR